MPPGITGMPVITQMPVMPEPGIPGRDYGTMGHERCTYINDLFEEMYRIPVGEEMIGIQFVNESEHDKTITCVPSEDSDQLVSKDPSFLLHMDRLD